MFLCALQAKSGHKEQDLWKYDRKGQHGLAVLLKSAKYFTFSSDDSADCCFRSDVKFHSCLCPLGV